MIKGETPNFYPKLLDKDGNLINIGDVLYGKDGKAWKITMVAYAENMTYPLVAHNVKEDGTEDPLGKCLKPEWLSRRDPKPKPFELGAGTLNEWMADLQCVISELPVGDYPLKNHLFDLIGKMRQVAEGEGEADKWEDFI